MATYRTRTYLAADWDGDKKCNRKITRVEQW